METCSLPIVSSVSVDKAFQVESVNLINSHTCVVLLTEYWICRVLSIAVRAPFMSGLQFQIAIGPRLANCAQLTSMKKSGMPTVNSMMRYGMRNAPRTQTRHAVYNTQPRFASVSIANITCKCLRRPTTCATCFGKRTVVSKQIPLRLRVFTHSDLQSGLLVSELQ